MTSRFPSFRWFVRRATEAFIALTLAYLTVHLIEYREAVKRADVPATDWFILDEIYVPDHDEGSDPTMVYARRILTDHRGFWVAEAQRVNPDGRQGVFQNVCSGSGLDDYDTTEVLGVGNTVSWSWFFGRPCRLPPGTYRIQLTRDMSKTGFPVKQTRDWSNTFHIVP